MQAYLPQHHGTPELNTRAISEPIRQRRKQFRRPDGQSAVRSRTRGGGSSAQQRYRLTNPWWEARKGKPPRLIAVASKTPEHASCDWQSLASKSPAALWLFGLMQRTNCGRLESSLRMSATSCREKREAIVAFARAPPSAAGAVEESTQLIRIRREQGRSLVSGLCRCSSRQSLVSDGRGQQWLTVTWKPPPFLEADSTCRTRTWSEARPIPGLSTCGGARRVVCRPCEREFVRPRPERLIGASQVTTCRSRWGRSESRCLFCPQEGEAEGEGGREGREKRRDDCTSPAPTGVYYAAGGRFEAGGGVPVVECCKDAHWCSLLSVGLPSSTSSVGVLSMKPTVGMSIPSDRYSASLRNTCRLKCDCSHSLV